MITYRKTLLALSLVSLVSAAAYAQAPMKAQDGALVSDAGMTVYTFDKDSANSGKSACNDQCAKAWPPVAAAAGAKPAGDYTLVTRDDGTKQWAYKGMPLYTFAKDTKPGEKKGDNVRDVWHIVKQ